MKIIYAKYRLFAKKLHPEEEFSLVEILEISIHSLKDRIYFGRKWGDKQYLRKLIQFSLSAMTNPFLIETDIFDSRFYIYNYSDIRSSRLIPWKHYHKYGILETRRPALFVDIFEIEIRLGKLSSPQGYHFNINAE